MSSFACSCCFSAIAKREALQRTYHDLQRSQSGRSRVKPSPAQTASPLDNGYNDDDGKDDDVEATAAALARQADRIQREVTKLLSSRSASKRVDDDEEDN